MKIVICGSMSSAKKMVALEIELKKFDHMVILPRHAREYANGDLAPESSHESTQNKINHDLIRDHYEKIKAADAVLIVNETKNGIKDYIGGNAFLELGYGHALRKKTFILNGIPDMIYTDEILAMQPVILNGDINKIK
ncbi:hypothetical protein A2303_06215 [Candidatus Falkowbacteria bacterium RIFOXYB2_FULL_47_14]|uniref:Maf-like protein n=1 Tax=Candidatus Falkowbacteria bacterium RIFOXYA2_FULL_47_19 TaxID=1797994 RepID=A0A1F5SMQ3_9BACT|nr:MAG: hypothetical protein A2227_05180 [Candidatus Falkowbacteria bacterium RIFOXYA2_FULL_47_19]OGF43156.1 MAG: hypothetical protein A2303_06215 [Candidatus Falkowbacteria bacterium RIFOXYB2_FULL_47_14]